MAKATRKRRDLSGGKGAEAADNFNCDFPIGATVWYWHTLPFGPVRETTVRGEAYVIPPGYSNSGLPVANVKGVAGYVSVFNITEPKEDQRQHVEFVK